MAQRIDVPGMGIVEFPDGMSDADISAAIKRSLPSREQAPSVADDVGAGEAMLIGAGREADRLLKGVRQMYYGATGNEQKLAELKDEEAFNSKAFGELQAKRPIATAVGGAPTILAVPMTGAGSAIGMVGRAALSGGAMEGLKYGTPQERALRGATGALGAAAGAGLGLGLSRVLKPAGSAAGVSDDAMQAADRLGYKVTPGQATQNPAMLNFENYLSRSPGSAGRMQVINEGNQKALNTAAAKAMGENADNLGEGVFNAAKSRMGQEFERLQQITGPDMARPEFMQALIKIDSSNAARGPFASKNIQSLVDKGLDLASKGKITGQAYKEIHSELASASTSAFRSGDSTLGQALKTVREAMDDAAKSSLSGVDQKAWDTVRRQWGAYKVLVKGNVAEAGDVSAARLASKVRADPRFRTGQMSGELADIARVGEAFKSVPNPNSGNLTQSMIYGNPLTGLPMAVGNNLMSRAYLSGPGQRYLTNGLLNVGPTGQGLLSQGGAAAGDAAMLQWLGAQ